MMAVIECTKCLKWYHKDCMCLDVTESYRHEQRVCIPCKDLKTIHQPLLSPNLSLKLLYLISLLHTFLLEICMFGIATRYTMSYIRMHSGKR